MNTRTISFRYLALIPGIMLIPILSSAQAIAPEAVKNPPSQFPVLLNDPITYLWLLIVAVLIAVIFALSRSVRVMGEIINAKTMTAGKTIEAKDEIVKENVWSKLMKSMTRSVPVEQEADVMLDHDYDGIRELDNKLPPWWVWGFYITIIFAFVYIINYHITGSGKLQIAEYNEEVRIAAAEREQRMQSDANFVTAVNVVRLTDPSALGEGKDIWQKNCVACHGNGGQGGVGPNMTDEYWIHGGGIKNIFQVVTEGVPAKGMISWKSQLSPKQIQAVSSFILTLQGTTPPDPKAPQGEKWIETAPDSTVMNADTSQTAKIN